MHGLTEMSPTVKIAIIFSLVYDTKVQFFSPIEQYFSNSQAFAWSLPRLHQVCWKMSLFVLFNGVTENIYLYNLFDVGIDIFLCNWLFPFIMFIV